MIDFILKETQGYTMDKKSIDTRIVKGDLSHEYTQYILINRPIVFADIETDGLDPKGKIGLITIYTEEYGAELVHLPNRDMYNFRSVCIDKQVKKVFHHAPFDMKFLMTYANIRFNSVECTRIAGVTLDTERQYKHSLQAMLEQYIDVKIPKGQALSNWFATDLTDEQIRYAIEDVKYLPALMYTLYGKMIIRDRLKLYQDACAYLPTKCYFELLGVNDVYGR